MFIVYNRINKQYYIKKKSFFFSLKVKKKKKGSNLYLSSTELLKFNVFNIILDTDCFHSRITKKHHDITMFSHVVLCEKHGVL